MSQALAGPHHAVKMIGDVPCQLSYPGVVGLSDRNCQKHGQQVAICWDGSEICLGCVETQVEALKEIVVSSAFSGHLQPDDQRRWRQMTVPAASLHCNSSGIEDMTKRHMALAAVRYGVSVEELLNNIRGGQTQANDVIAKMYPHA